MSADTKIPDPDMSQSFNRYSFCIGNPVNFVDVSGHNWLSRGLGNIGVAVAGTVGAIKAIGNRIKDGFAAVAIGDVSGAKAIGNGINDMVENIKNTDWKRVGFMVLGAVVTGITAFTVAACVLTMFPIFATVISMSVLGQAIIAGSIGIGAGLIGGYNCASRGDNLSTLVRGSMLLGLSIGSNIVTSAIYYSYMARIMITYPIAYACYKAGWIKSYDSVLDIAFGKEYTINDYDGRPGGRTERACPWFPGAPHTFGADKGEGKNAWDFKDWHTAYKVFDLLGGHALSVVHDYDSDKYNSRHSGKDRDPWHNVFNAPPSTFASATGTEWIFY